MSFQDRQQGSITSLLAQLRAAQDGPPAPAPPSKTSTTKKASEDTGVRPVRDHSGASSKQLNDLLSSLGKTPSSSSPSAEPSPRRQLIEPFGPVSTLSSSSPSKPKIPLENQSQGVDIKELSFTKALPIISTLLSDEVFKAEVKRMKVDQDTLERRLWAKMEKVKGDHEKGTRTDREIANITGTPISPNKKKEWDRKLESTLQEFYRNTCLPSIDGLAARHRMKLEEMGVPGLGGDMGEKGTRERVRRIMDVLEGGLEE